MIAHSSRWLFVLIFGLLAACDAAEEPVSRAGDLSAGPNSPELGGRTLAQEHDIVPEAESEVPAKARDSASMRVSDARVDTRKSNDLISDLQELDWSRDIDEHSDANELLERLRSEGANALLPIRDFLLENMNSEEMPPGLRQALLDVLFGLRLQEVEDVVLQLLAAGPPPSEMVQLGVYLESVQPGRYSELIRSAAELALMEADPAVLLSPAFFLLLGEFGNAETAVLLGRAPPHQEAYAGLTLAELRDDSGLPILAQYARVFEAGRDTVQGRLALQLLAQRAAQSESAAAVLLELAEQGVIPQGLWPYLLDLVAGNWELSLIEPPAELLVGSHTYYRPEGNQIIWRVARPPYGVDDGLQEQRLHLLDLLQSLAPSSLLWVPEP